MNFVHTSPPLDPHRIAFRESSAALPANMPAVDPVRGKISGVSLLTADREAAGHGLWIDNETLRGFHALLVARPLKAYVTHDHGDGTLEEAGFWGGCRIDGLHLRADFSALDAWRKHEAAQFDTLFEMAAKLPGEFGASLSFGFNLAWVDRAGRETATLRKFRLQGGVYEQYFDPPAPAGSLREMPSVRATAVYSADFVDQPAANTGLFSSESGRTPASGKPHPRAAKFASGSTWLRAKAEELIRKCGNLSDVGFKNALMLEIFARQESVDRREHEARRDAADSASLGRKMTVFDQERLECSSDILAVSRA